MTDDKPIHPNPGFTFIAELPLSAELVKCGDLIIVVAPDHPPQIVTPEGLKPLDQHPC